MGTLALKLDSDAVNIETTDLMLRVVLADGRELAAPSIGEGEKDMGMATMILQCPQG